MNKSTHKVEIIKLHDIKDHPNADRLSIVQVFNYQCIIQKGQFGDGDLAAYIPPDSVVPDAPEYAFLGGHRRIKVKKLRGVVSMGLLMPAPEGSRPGDDVAEFMGIAHYEPPDLTTGGENAPPPPGYHPNYDVDTLYRYAHLFQPGETVWVTEKIHGSSGRWACIDGQMYCGSRHLWKKESDTSIWWKALRKTPEVEDFCRANSAITVYGEVYGWVQDLRYGAKPGEVKIAVFDLLFHNDWVQAQVAREVDHWGPKLPWVPKIGEIAFDADALFKLADGPSLVPEADHLREGIVIKPLFERTHPEIGRVQLKVVSNEYLERS